MLALIVMIISAQFINLGYGNPYTKAQYSGTKPAPLGTKPPNISIQFPENTVKYNSHNLSLNFSVSTGQSGLSMAKVGYFGSWQKAITYINFTEYNYTIPPMFSVNLKDIPEGNNTITVSAVETGILYTDFFHYYDYFVNNFLSVEFFVDTASPTIMLYDINNATSSNSNIQLNFTVNEPTLQISYILDNQEVLIAGNTTISNVREGSHNIKIQALDEAGNVGISKTVNFNVESSPSTMIAVSEVSAAVIVIVAVVTLLYWKRHKHRVEIV